ncbi:MAG: glycine--tRNA ligase subunit beta [Halieaceae bacterium]
MNASTSDFLFELGTEELPSGSLCSMVTALEQEIVAGLAGKGLGHGEVRRFATPRRLAVTIKDVALEADDETIEVAGPPLASAKTENGEWTPAALGFAKKQGVSAEDLIEIDDPKGPRLGLRRIQKGAIAASVLPDIISAAVAAIPVAKRMRWGRERHEFLRPVQWLVALLGEEVLPVSLFGLNSDNRSRGHRFHHAEPVVITNPHGYEQALSAAFVIADFDERKAVVEKQVREVAQALGATAVIEDDLLEEVTGLVEWPVALSGSFDPAFLEVPSAAVISSMKEHQKYFHLLDKAGELLPLFITVSNITSHTPTSVVTGNEKVIRPRLSDAAFFFNTDKKTPLIDRETKLETVIFQQKLGSVADKTRRVVALSGWLADTLSADRKIAERGAALSKCDLVSDMVLEFPDLQGIAGGHYARHDGEPEQVAACIEQHYWPKFSGDNLPQSPEATCVALADRLDTLVGIFGIGQVPTGSKDPFALRRASLAVIRMLLSLDVDIDLGELIAESAATYPPDTLEPDASTTLISYILERLRAWYEDQSISVDTLRAVTVTGITRLTEIDRRVQALHQFSSTEAAVALSAANKRVANILSKTEDDFRGPPKEDQLSEPEEKQLFAALNQADLSAQPKISAGDYAGALEVLSVLREPVDLFFENVMVNVEDPEIRANRLRLLGALRDSFIRVGDIALLSSGKGAT